MYKNPKPTVDVVVTDGKRVVLIKRGRDPFKGQWVFPGGFVDYGETVEDAAVREVMEETGLNVRLETILGVYSDPDRDPRGHNVTVAFIGHVIEGEPVGGDDADEAEWRNIETIIPEELAFDHGVILTDLKEWLQDKTRTFWSTAQR
ncbi:MAG: NUDIX domain-containing protein [Candidatus Thorarchaeota archaeon]